MALSKAQRKRDEILPEMKTKINCVTKHPDNSATNTSLLLPRLKESKQQERSARP